MYKDRDMRYINYIERKPTIMTNFNHAQIAKNIAQQIEEFMIDNNCIQNDATAFRVVFTHWFAKFNRDQLIDQPKQQRTVALYNEAIEQTTSLGKALMNCEGGEVCIAKATKLRKATIELVAQELEGGHAGDFDLVLRFLVQIQMIQLHSQLKNKAGEEAAELATDLNNAIVTAVDAELEVANAA